jgi:hypothetical protein
MVLPHFDHEKLHLYVFQPVLEILKPGKRGETRTEYTVDTVSFEMVLEGLPIMAMPAKCALKLSEVPG